MTGVFLQLMSVFFSLFGKLSGLFGLSGKAKNAENSPTSSQPRALPTLVKIGLVGSLIFGGVQTIRLAMTDKELRHRKEVIQNLTAWRDDLVSSIRLASGSPKVTHDSAKAQILALGQSVTLLKESIIDQNKRIDQLGEQTVAAQKLAKVEREKREAAITTARKLAAHLETEATKAVQPNEVEAEIRRVQDQLYENGQ